MRGFGSYIVPYLIVKDSLYADLTADPINLTPLQAQLFPLARATHNDQHKQGSIFLTLNGIQQSVYFSRLQYPDVLPLPLWSGSFCILKRIVGDILVTCRILINLPYVDSILRMVSIGMFACCRWLIQFSIIETVIRFIFQSSSASKCNLVCPLGIDQVEALRAGF